MTNLLRSVIYGRARKENIYQRLMSCNSSFIFSRRDDQRNRRLPANNDEIRSSSRSLSFSLDQSRSCSSSEGNGQIMKGCSISKTALQDSLSKGLSQPQLRVARLESHPEGVEVVVKWPEGRRKMTLEVRRVGEGDHQADLLLGPLSKISRYLEETLGSHLTPQYIPLPRFFNINIPQLEEEEETGEKSKLEKGLETVFGVEIPGPAGFLSLSQGALADYEHSALTISAIARLLACSYFCISCMLQRF